MVATRETLELLREQVRRIEAAGRPSGEAVSLGCPALDALLPARGLERGTIHEWLAAHAGSGAEILSLLAAREACREGGALVVIDAAGWFYPPAAALWGIRLENAIVVRPDSRRDAAWAIDQALRCSAVAAVWGRVDVSGERWLRRFQLSSEQSGCVGLFIRPAAAARRPSWSAAQWICRGVRICRGAGIYRDAARRNVALGAGNFLRRRVAGRPPCSTFPAQGRESELLVPEGERPELATLGRGASEDRWIRVQLARLRGGLAGASVTLRIDFQTGGIQAAREHDEASRVRLSRRLADPAVDRRAARA